MQFFNLLNSVYNKNEIDNKFSTLETNVDWKEAVDTFDDITTIYSSPEDGWTVNVKDTDYTYRYNGTEWVTISANAIPKATQLVDGLFTKEDKTKLDGISTGAEANQNAFSNVVVGSTTIAANSKTDTLTLAGSNVTLTPDATNDKITIGITKDNVINALGYTPGSSVDSNTTYTLSKSGSTITLTGSDGSTTSVTDTDTHYTSHLYVGASGENANATSATSDPYLLCVDNTTNRDSVQLKAGSNMGISATSGVVTFTSTQRSVSDSLTSTSTTTALSSAGGKSLQDQITTLNSNLINLKTHSSVETVIGKLGNDTLYRYVVSTSAISGTHKEINLPFSYSKITKINVVVRRDNGMLFNVPVWLGDTTYIQSYVNGSNYVMDWTTTLTLNYITCEFEYIK